MNVKRAMLVVPLALAAAGCQTWGPTWSEVSGDRYYNRAIALRQPAVIQKIDGNSSFASRPIKLEPGTHVIEISGVAPRPAAGGAMLKTITVDVAPCKIYYINAQYAQPVDIDYTPVIDYVDTVPGCKATG